MIERNALREINDPRAEDMLIEALRDRKTRWKAAFSLGDLQVERAVVPLIALLKSAEKDDRGVAAEALGSIKDQRATDPLCAALKDRDEVVRRYAASALGELGDVRAVETLSDALRDPDDGVRWNASKSLGDLKDPKAVDPLAGILNDSEENVRKAAADALGKIGDSRATGALIAAFKSGNRWHSAAALANLKDPRAADLLSARSKQGDLDVVAAAHVFFIRKGDSGSVPALISALNKYGRWEMAQNYLGSRNSQLVDAANKWASRNGYEGLSPSEDRTLIWGSSK